MTASKIAKEDEALLKFAGLMGHEFVGISGNEGERRVCCECNSLDSGKRLADGKNAAVYRKAGKRRWELAWTGE